MRRPFSSHRTKGRTSQGYKTTATIYTRDRTWSTDVTPGGFVSRMFCYICIPPQKRKWFGFFCRDLLLRSLEKANITGEEITENNTKFTYKYTTVTVTQDIERARLKIEVESRTRRVGQLRRLYQIFHESAEGVTAAFSEVEVTLVLQHERWEFAATDVMKTAKAGDELVTEWKGDKFCNVDDFEEFLPRYYVSAYLSWDLKLETRAAVDNIK